MLYNNYAKILNFNSKKLKVRIHRNKNEYL